MLKISMIVWNEFQNDARVLKQAETLQSAGYQVTVHALHTPGITQQQETLLSGVKVERIPRSPFWKHHKKPTTKTPADIPPSLSPSFKRQMLRIAARLYTHARLFMAMFRLNADIIQAHDVNTLPTAWFVASLRRKQLVYDAHEVSTSREGYVHYRALVFYVEKYLMPRAAATLTTSRIRAKFFSRAYHIPRPLVLQNRPRFISLEKTNKIRTELQLETDWPIVLYQGGLQQGRGLEYLIDAARQVPNAYFVFIGSGRLEPFLKNKVAMLNLQHRIRFIPKVPLDQLLYYTASADIGVQILQNTCFNHYSTDSNKLFEYIMANVPIIASSFPEIKKIVHQYDLGLLIESRKTSALVDALQKLITNPSLRKYYQEQARNASIQLNWEEQEASLIALYKTLLPQ